MNLGPKEIADLSIAYSRCMAQLEGQGCRVRVVHDFGYVAELLESYGKEVTPFFQAKFFDFNGSNGFCHIAYAKGEPISFYCSQVFDLGRLSYQDFHRLQLRRIYGDAYKIDLDWSCPPMEAIRGRVFYSGDALNVQGSRSATGSLQRLQILAKASLYVGLMTWQDSEASVGLARAKHVAKGLGYCYGAFHAYPDATHWITPPPDRRQDDVFLFSTASDILYQARVDGIQAVQESEG